MPGWVRPSGWKGWGPESGGSGGSSPYPTLPMTLDFTGGVPASPNWAWIETPTSVVSEAPVTIDSHTPSVNPVVGIACNAGVHGNLQYNGIYNAGQKFDLTLGVRIQLYGALKASFKRRQWSIYLWNQAAGWYNTGVDMYVNTNFATPNDKYFLREIIAGASNTIRNDSNPGTGKNHSDFNPHWVRMNFEFTLSQCKYYEWLSDDGLTTLQTDALTKDFSAIALDTINCRLASYDFAHGFQIASIWIGTSADAFPT